MVPRLLDYQIAAIVLGGIAVLWSLAVGVHYRAEIQEQIVRARFFPDFIGEVGGGNDFPQKDFGSGYMCVCARVSEGVGPGEEVHAAPAAAGLAAPVREA
eukprot:2827269-Rhodomonas_salina.2